MNTLSGKNISKIGMGSYGVGGRGHRDMSLTEKLDDTKYVESLVYSLNSGLNFIELSLGYGHGASIELFKKALDLSGVDRRDLFITNSLYPRDLPSIDIINQDIKDFYNVLQTDYADSTLVTQSLILKFGERPIYSILHELLDNKKTRYVSLSNASPNWIRKFKEEFSDKFVAHEGHLSFEMRALQDKGVFETCENLNVENIIWRPLRRNMTNSNNWSILNELASKYNKTPNQIILNWICNLGYRPMVMSANKNHIEENIASLSFTMSQNDYELLTNFRPPDYHASEIDWEGIRIDDDIVRVVNSAEGFDKYAK